MSTQFSGTENFKNEVPNTEIKGSFFLNSEAKILADINFLAGIKFVEAYWFKTAQNVILDSWDETPCLLII